MYFDALTLAAVVDQCQSTILGGRIQRVLLPNMQSLGLEIYANGRRHQLLLSAHPQLARAHLLSQRPSRGVEGNPPLVLLARKYLVGGRITAIEQPPFERVVVFSIVKGPQARNIADLPPDDDAADDDPDEPLDEPMRCDLVAEVMERRGNVILVNNNNMIMESIRRVPPRVSQRPIQPHEPYELPPRQDKRDPTQASAAGVQHAAEQGGDLARALVAAYRGLSPQAAREAVFRATGTAQIDAASDLPWDALASHLRELWSAPWEPCLARTADGKLAFAPYRLTHLHDSEPQPTISVALEAWYASREQVTAHNQRRQALAAQLLDSRDWLARQQRQLQGELEQVQRLEQLRWEGEMIYAFLHAIGPRQTTLDVEGHTITLDPKRSAVENAQSRFKAYDKAKGALANVPERLAAVEARIAGLDELLALLELADGYDQIEGMAHEAVELGYLKHAAGKRTTKRRPQPLRVLAPDGTAIYVGRSSLQNEYVTFTLATSDDMWLHVRNIPGAHVVIKNNGEPVSDATLELAAGLAAYFSKARTNAAVDVEIARRRLVRRVPGGPAGLVTYKAERTLRVAPQAPSAQH